MEKFDEMPTKILNDKQIRWDFASSWDLIWNNFRKPLKQSRKALKQSSGSLLTRKQKPEFKLTKRFFGASWGRTKTRKKPSSKNFKWNLLLFIRSSHFLPSDAFSEKPTLAVTLQDLFNEISCRSWRQSLEALKFGEQLKLGPWPDRKRSEAARIFELNFRFC